MKVGDIKTDLPKPVVVKEDATAVDVAKALKEKNMKSAFVVNASGEPVGIATMSDLTFNVVAEGKDAASVKVVDIMTENVVVCSVENNLADVIQEMSRRKFFSLPVMKEGEIVGVLTYQTAMKQFYAQHVCSPKEE